MQPLTTSAQDSEQKTLVLKSTKNVKYKINSIINTQNLNAQSHIGWLLWI